MAARLDLSGRPWQPPDVAVLDRSPPSARSTSRSKRYGAAGGAHRGKRARNARGRRDWENWVTTDDLDGLARWQDTFGPGFRAVIAFAYAEVPLPFPLPEENGAFAFRGLDYRFWAVGLDDYVAHLRSRGPAWKAVAMARAEFRRRVRPLSEWLPMTVDSPRRPQPVRKDRER